MSAEEAQATSAEIERGPEPAAGEARPKLDLLIEPRTFAVLLGALAVLLSLWFAPYRNAPNDEGAMLTAASKILRGGVFYRDIDSYPFPLAPYLLAGGMALFGESLAVARHLAILVFATIVLALYGIALKLLDRRRAAVFGLALLSFKFLGWPGYTSFVYWDLSLAFGLVAVYLFLGHGYRGPSLRLMAVGVLAALALLAKQNLAIYLGGTIALLLLFPERLLGIPRLRGSDRWRELGAVAGGALLPALPMVLYFGAQGVLPQMIYGGLIRPFTGYLPTSGVSFFEPLKWWKLGELYDIVGRQYFVEPFWTMLMKQIVPGTSWYGAYWVAGELFSRILYTSIPVAVLLALRAWLRKSPVERRQDAQLWTCAALSGAILLSAFPRADFAHIIGVYPVVLLLIFALLQGVAESAWGSWLRRAELCAVALLLVSTTALAAVHHAHLTQRVDLPRARFWDYPDSWVQSVARFVLDEVPEGEPLFVYGNDSYYYFLTGRFFPWPFSTLYPGQTGPDEGRTLAELLNEQQPKLVIRGLLGWPGLPSIPSYARYLDYYVASYYETDGRVFQRYPLPAGQKPPEAWVLSVMRRKASPTLPPRPRP